MTEVLSSAAAAAADTAETAATVTDARPRQAFARSHADAAAEIAGICENVLQTRCAGVRSA
jgi:hypothetical protein